MTARLKRTPAQQVHDLRTERDRISRELRDVKHALNEIRDAVFSGGSDADRLAKVRKVLGDNLEHTVTQSGWYDLVRYFDGSGQSGTGRVAEIARFQDGTVAMRWLSKTPSTVLYDDIDHVARIHGHSGATELVPR